MQEELKHAPLPLPQPMRVEFERPHGLVEMFYYTADQMRKHGEAERQEGRRDMHETNIALVDQICDLSEKLERRTPVSGEAAAIPAVAGFDHACPIDTPYGPADCFKCTEENLVSTAPVARQDWPRTKSLIANGKAPENEPILASAAPGQAEIPAQTGIDHAKLAGQERQKFLDLLWGHKHGGLDNTDALLAAWQARGQQAGNADHLLKIIGYAYQVAGAHDAPEHILDVLADPEAATDEQVEAMLPYWGQQAGGAEDGLSSRQLEEIAASYDGAWFDGLPLGPCLREAFAAARANKQAPEVPADEDKEKSDE